MQDEVTHTAGQTLEQRLDAYLQPLDGSGMWKYNSIFTHAYAESNILCLYETVGEVFAPMHMIASAVSKADFQVRTWSNPEEEVTSSGFDKLINRPNWMQSWEKFIYDAVISELLGNRYWWTRIPSTLPRNPANINSIWTLPPQHVMIDMKQNRPTIYAATGPEDVVERYRLTMGQDSRDFQPNEVLHEPTLQNGDWLDWDTLKGYSPLKAAEKAITNLVAVYEARGIIYQKRGALGIIVNRAQDTIGAVAMDENEKKSLRQQLDGKFGLRRGQDTIAITSQNVDYIRTSMSIEELQPFEETKADAQVVYAVLGVPDLFMPGGTGQASTRENMRTATRNFYQDTIIPCATRISSAIHRAIGMESSRFIYPDFSHVEALQANKKEEAQTLQTLTSAVLNQYKANLITKNRARILLHEEPVAGEDTYYRDEPEQQAAAEQAKILTQRATVN